MVLSSSPDAPGTAREGREAKIPKGFQASVIAIDGPLLPLGAGEHVRRHVEFVFSRAPFHNRCKNALSHSGVGFDFRKASADAYAQFGRILANSLPSNGALVSRLGPMVVAFPNAFLGVLMLEEKIVLAPKFRRARRFDWLYEEVVTTGRLESLLSKGLDQPTVVWQRLRSETDHELRAALVCLLTVALAEKGTATIIGETEGGWFWLPPWSLWEAWATNGLEATVARALDRPLPP